MNTANPFPVLTLLSRLLRGLGWAIAAAGALYALTAGIIEPMLPNHRFDMGSDGFDLAVGVGIAVLGIGLVAYGELVGVAFAIEANTRRAADAAAAAQARQP